MDKNPSKNIFFTLCIFVLLSSFQLQMQSFTASYQGADIRLEWKVSEETGVTAYEISRKKDSDPNYYRLTEVAASSAVSYTWLDDNLYKDGDASENINYRLTAVSSSGQKSFYTNIQHSPTAVQRSWGSIKSMFR